MNVVLQTVLCDQPVEQMPRISIPQKDTSKFRKLLFNYRWQANADDPVRERAHQVELLVPWAK